MREVDAANSSPLRCRVGVYSLRESGACRVIDIIIPTRNAPESLWLCLTHLWAFATPELVSSVVILDNCSTDKRNREILEVANKMPRHHVLRHEQNVGVWCSINRGLALSTSPLAMVITSDVLIGPDTLEHLAWIHKSMDLAYFGPDVVTGLSESYKLSRSPERHGEDITVSLDFSRYNGACWVMDWPLLRENVGWYDPQFYISFGDVDYIERVKQWAMRKESQGSAPCVYEGLYICHLDKQTRRADMDSRQDTHMEIMDGGRFREKWKDHPDVLAKHPPLSEEQYLAFKARDLGGWEAAKV